jgi:hypothetical protein
MAKMGGGGWGSEEGCSVGHEVIEHKTMQYDPQH